MLSFRPWCWPLAGLCSAASYQVHISYWHCASSWMCFHNKSERLTLLKCTVQHLWKNPLKSAGTRRGGLLLACTAEHCQGEFQLCPAVFSVFPHWQAPRVGWAGLMTLYLPTVAGSSDLRVCVFFLHSSVLRCWALFSPLFCASEHLPGQVIDSLLGPPITSSSLDLAVCPKLFRNS